MAIMRAGALAGQLSGRVGGVIFSRNRGGDYVRNGPCPVNPSTTYQVLVRNALATASTRWNDVAFTYRPAWEAWAKTNPIQNRLGETIRLQGNAAFVALNSRLVQTGAAVVDTPPIVSSPAGLLTATGSFDIGAGSFQVAYTTTPLAAGMKLWVRGCLFTSPAIMFVKNRLRHFYTSAAAAASPADLQATFTTWFGAPTVGQTVIFRAAVLDSANGQLSRELECRGLVVST